MPSGEAVTAAILQGARNRLTIAPELVRRVAHIGGYNDVLAGDALTDVMDVGDLIELIVFKGLEDLELPGNVTRAKEAAVAREILTTIAQGRAVTRAEVHDALPPDETVLLMRMGAPQLWGFAVQDLAPAGIEEYVPEKIGNLDLGPNTDEAEAWIGRYFVDASEYRKVQVGTHRLTVDDERDYRIRIGMSLADGPDEVWSSARGHWHINPSTRYIVPSRFGWCPYVFRVNPEDWRADDFGDGRVRHIAKRRVWIDPARESLVEMGEPDERNYWLPKMQVLRERPSDKDLKVARAISGKVVALGPSAKNPIVRLRQKGRKLY